VGETLEEIELNYQTRQGKWSHGIQVVTIVGSDTSTAPHHQTSKPPTAGGSMITIRWIAGSNLQAVCVCGPALKCHINMNAD